MDRAAEFGQRLEQGRLNRVILEGEQRIAIAMRASKRTILVVLLPHSEKLGVITLAMRRASAQIAGVFA
jgi:predicted regulator of Ras-like GTPase activity (Roadblock/LC7/MglB family)